MAVRTCRPRAAAWGVLLAAASSGCMESGGPKGTPSPPPVFFEFADPTRGPNLTEGWSRPERSENGKTAWVWATAERARVKLRLDSSEYRQLTFHCWPAIDPEGPPRQTLRLTINGEEVDRFELLPHHFTYTAELPGDVLRTGDNVLEFAFRHVLPPERREPSGDAGGLRDERSLAAAFIYFELSPGDGGQRRTAHKIALSGEVREAVELSPGTSWQRSFGATRGTEWVLSFALYCPQDEHCRGARTFVAEAGSEPSRRVVVFRRTVEAATSARRWRTDRLTVDDLSGLNLDGETVDFRFSVYREGGEPEPPGGPEIEPRAFWGRPLVIRPPGAGRRVDNVVLISIDTLRADRLGSYGYPRDTSPALDALAAEGVRFSQAISQSPWTTPSHMSLMTSLYPSSHRVNQSWNDLGTSPGGQVEVRALPGTVTTLAEIFRRQGYRTLALTGGATIVGKLGFWRGFDVYHENFGDLERGFFQLDERVASKLSDWLDAYGRAPFFLFFHTFEVHAPYVGLDFAEAAMTAPQRAQLQRLLERSGRRPLPAQKQFLEEHGLFKKEVTSALYDGGIRRVDAFLRRFFEELRRRGLYDRTMIVVTSDHGEEFGEHDPGRFYNAHCDSAYDELLRVPLIVRLPGSRPVGKVVDRQVELLDVAPTILDLLGFPVPSEMQGRSLKRWIEGVPAASRSEPRAVSEAACQGAELKAYRTPRYKYVAAYTPDGGDRTGLSGTLEWERIFDLRTDPGERHSLHHDRELLAEMRARLEEHFRELGAPPPDEEASVDASADREALRALGYVD